MIFLIVRALLAAIAGWLAGAIINYISDVLPQNRRLIHPHCTHCNANIPADRYLFNSVCEQCKTQFSVRHWIITFTLPLVYVLMATIGGRTGWSLIENMSVVAFFGLIIVIDIEHHLILHTVSAFGAVLLGIIGFLNHGWRATLIGGGTGLIIMFALFIIGYYFSKIISKRRGVELDEGLGFGDVILSFVCGLLLGWPGISLGLFTGIVLGGVYSLALIIYYAIKKQYQPYMTIPYGPFIAGATLFYWLIR